MIDLYLRFASQQDALDALRPLGLTFINAPIEDGDPVEEIAQGSHRHAAWEVGEIPGRDGWHINLRVLDPALDLTALDPFRIYPKTPSIVWA